MQDAGLLLGNCAHSRYGLMVNGNLMPIAVIWVQVSSSINNEGGSSLFCKDLVQCGSVEDVERPGL